MWLIAVKGIFAALINHWKATLVIIGILVILGCAWYIHHLDGKLTAANQTISTLEKDNAQFAKDEKIYQAEIAEQNASITKYKEAAVAAQAELNGAISAAKQTEAQYDAEIVKLKKQKLPSAANDVLNQMLKDATGGSGK